MNEITKSQLQSVDFEINTSLFLNFHPKKPFLNFEFGKGFLLKI